MSLVKWAFIVILLLPVAEIALFIVMAVTIGWLWTLALFLGTSLIGVMLLRHSGRQKLQQFGAALNKDGVRAVHLESPGLAPMLGGILLVLPGFITDFLGVALFLPPLRRWAGAAFGRALRQRRRDPHAPAVIDLAPDQWDELPETKIEDQRPRKGAP
ncbi:MAG: protein FxsA [Alphaproteobacteria bacterium]|nr:protein FxsA [Alphaproteobacteria bacterium]